MKHSMKGIILYGNRNHCCHTQLLIYFVIRVFKDFFVLPSLFKMYIPFFVSSALCLVGFNPIYSKGLGLCCRVSSDCKEQGLISIMDGWESSPPCARSLIGTCVSHYLNTLGSQHSLKNVHLCMCVCARERERGREREG